MVKLRMGSIHEQKVAPPCFKKAPPPLENQGGGGGTDPPSFYPSKKPILFPYETCSVKVLDSTVQGWPNVPKLVVRLQIRKHRELTWSLQKY